MQYLLKNTTDKKKRAYLLNHYLDSFKGTVYRQTMFAEFEREAHRMAESGESLTSAVAIAKNILKNGAPAVEAYKEFLSSGCTQDPVSLLKIAGVNPETPQPIQDALDTLNDILILFSMFTHICFLIYFHTFQYVPTYLHT